MARNVSITLTLNSSGFTAGMTGAATATATFNANTNAAARSLSNIERRLTGIVGTARDTIQILGGLRGAFDTLRASTLGWVGQIVEANSNMQRMTFLLQGLAKATDTEGKIREAGDDVQYLLDKAKQAPFSLTALSGSFVKLKSAGLEETRQSMDSLVDAVAAFGGSNEILDRASISIQQMAGKGVISMEELRQQLGEAVPSAMRLMADSMGLSIAELTKKVSTGTVEAKSALGKFFDELDRTFGGRAAALMQTFGGQIAQAQTNLISFANVVGGLQKDGTFRDGSFMAALTDAVKQFNAALQTDDFRSFAAQLGAGLANLTTQATGLVSVLIQAAPLLIGLGKIIITYFVASAIVGTISNIVQSFRNWTAATGPLITAIRNVKSELSLVSQTFGLFSRGAITGVQAARDLGTSLRTIGPAMAELAGPAFIAVTVILQAAEAMGIFRNKVAEADQAMLEFAEGIDTTENLKKIKTDIDNTTAAIEELKAQVKAGGIKIIDPSGGPDAFFPFSADVLKEKQKELADAQARLNAEQQTLADSSARLQAKIIENAAQNAVDLMTKADVAASAKYNKAKADYEAAKKAVNDDDSLDAAAKKVKLDELAKGWSASVHTFYDDLLAGSQAVYDQLEQMRKDLEANKPIDRNTTLAARVLGTETDVNKMKARILKAEDDVLHQLDARRQEANAAEARFDAPNVFVAPKIQGQQHLPFEAFTRWADSAKESTADLKAELAGTSGEVARFIQMFNDGRFDPKDPKGNILTFATKEAREANAEMQKLRATGIALAQKKDDVQNETKDTKVLDNLRDAAVKAQAEAAELGEAFATGFREADDATAKYDATIDATLNNAKKVTPEMQKLAAAAKAANAEARNLKQVLDLQAKTRDLKLNLIDDPRARAEAEYQIEVERANKLVNLDALTGERRKQAEKAVQDYIGALRDTRDRAQEGSFKKMLRQWQDTTTAMQDLESGWISDFTDKLLTGKESFADFVGSILEGLAKMILRAEIANAILAGMNYFNSSSTNTSAQGADGLYYTKGGAIDIRPRQHNGGVVGLSGGFGFYDPAVFRAAVRYHSGTMGAGLKPNEVASVLEKGETVRTKDQERAVQDALNGSGGQTPNVEVNLINQSGLAMDAQQQGSPKFDGRRWVVDIVMNELGTNGSQMSRQVKGLAAAK